MKKEYVFVCLVLGALFLNSCDTGSNDISVEPFEFLVTDEFNRTITQQSLDFFGWQPDSLMPHNTLPMMWRSTAWFTIR